MRIGSFMRETLFFDRLVTFWSVGFAPRFTCHLFHYAKDVARLCVKFWPLTFRSQVSGKSSGSSEDGVRASRLEHPGAARRPGSCLASEPVLVARGHIRQQLSGSGWSLYPRSTPWLAVA